MQSLFRLFSVICCAVISVHALPAEARRVALVIGNADYKIGPLQNPVNDASAVAEAFDKLGFDKIMLRKNLGFDGFRAALLEMARESAGADLGVVFFAGHGTEVNGRNFLIPVDAALPTANHLDLEAVSLDVVLNQLDGVTKLKLVILDACRNNLFPLAGSKRSLSRGLSRIEPEDNTLVVYAAKDGTIADDGKGRHSPFTNALLRHLAKPSLDVRRLFGYVRDDVMVTTNRAQQPHLYGTLGGSEIFLYPPSAAPVPSVAIPLAIVPPTPVPAPKPAVGTPSAKPAPPPTPKPKRTTSDQARPDAREYSGKIWPYGTIPVGATVSADTPHGKLNCTTAGPQLRLCSWQ
jgi:Caspase domain